MAREHWTFRQNTQPDDRISQVGDLWVKTSDNPESVYSCTDLVIGPTGLQKATWLLLAPESGSGITGLNVVFAGTTPNRSCQLQITDPADSSVHVLMEIDY